MQFFKQIIAKASDPATVANVFMLVVATIACWRLARHDVSNMITRLLAN